MVINQKYKFQHILMSNKSTEIIGFLCPLTVLFLLLPS